jgi:probable HAF family extracellular repeat protein
MNHASDRFWSLFILTAAFSAAAVANPARRYQLVNLDAAVGEQGVSPIAINNEGVVALRASSNGQIISLLYDSRIGQVVQRFPPENGVINAISKNGNTVGQGGFATIGWFVVGGVPGTVPFPGGTGSGALAVNNRGQVAGFINLPSGFFGSSHAVVYSTQNGELADLGTLGGNSSIAFAINERGQTTGWANVAGSPFDQPQHAFRFDGRVMEDLGTLGGDSSIGFAIDAQGRVAGFADAAAGRHPPRHAFLFDRDGMHDLGTLPGRRSSEARAMNNHGDAVGQSSFFGDLNSAHAVLFSRGGVVDLNDVAPDGEGFVHQTAAGINDSGAIIGQSMDSNFQFRAFLLLPLDDEE